MHLYSEVKPFVLSGAYSQKGWIELQPQCRAAVKKANSMLGKLGKGLRIIAHSYPFHIVASSYANGSHSAYCDGRSTMEGQQELSKNLKLW